VVLHGEDLDRESRHNAFQDAAGFNFIELNLVLLVSRLAAYLLWMARIVLVTLHAAAFEIANNGVWS